MKEVQSLVTRSGSCKDGTRPQWSALTRNQRSASNNPLSRQTSETIARNDGFVVAAIFIEGHEKYAFAVFRESPIAMGQ